MTPTLEGRLNESRRRLIALEQLLIKAAPDTPAAFLEDYKKVVALHREIDRWHELFETRRLALTQLLQLEDISAFDGGVPLGTGVVPFKHFRFLLVQSYVATKWALSVSARQLTC